MMLWVIIPVKALSHSKSRLTAVLSTQERADLTLQLLAHQLGVLSQVATIDGVMVVSRDVAVADQARAWGCEALVEEAHHDLNGALTEARDLLAAQASHLLILPSDLPLISVTAVEQLISQRPKAAICSDRHGTGTNGLLIPTAVSYPFAFGANSFQRHTQLFLQHSLPFRALSLPEIAFDLDTPTDWEAWQGMMTPPVC